MKQGDFSVSSIYRKKGRKNLIGKQQSEKKSVTWAFNEKRYVTAYIIRFYVNKNLY